MKSFYLYLFIVVLFFLSLMGATFISQKIEDSKNCLSPTSTSTPSAELKKWQCRVVVDCPSVDWRYFDPEDVCTYKMMTFTMAENPETNPDTKGSVEVPYGGWCKEIPTLPNSGPDPDCMK